MARWTVERDGEGTAGCFQSRDCTGGIARVAGTAKNAQRRGVQTLRRHGAPLLGAGVRRHERIRLLPPMGSEFIPVDGLGR